MSRPADTVVTAALRQLDPAPRSDLTRAERERADATFVQLVAAPSADHVATGTEGPRRRGRRLVVPFGLAGAAGVAVPVLLLGGGTAYGSWTPAPEALSEVAAGQAADTCRAALSVPDRGERVAMAERRGEWVYVLLAGAGAEAVCLLPDDLVGQDATDPQAFFATHDPDPPAPPRLGPGEIAEGTSMEGSTSEGWFTWTEGYVGRDVSGVTVHTGSGLDVEASVVGGRFAAWWPSTEQSSEHPAETWTYTVHLAGGSSRPAG